MTVTHEGLCSMVAAWSQANARVAEPSRLELTPETDLIATGVLDSLGFLELLTHVERITGIAVDLEDADPADFTTIGGLCRFALAPHAAEVAHVDL